MHATPRPGGTAALWGLPNTMARALRAPFARRAGGGATGPRPAWGVAGAALSMLGAGTAFAAVSRALYAPDETAHVDYAYQVWSGQLPVFEHGLVFRPAAGTVPPVQWEAQHPPLFYALLAPIVGPLINSGHWMAAVLAGRAYCVLIAVACVLALAWVGSLVSTKRPAAWAIAVPAVVAPFSPFMRVGGSVYNDNVATFFAILAMGIGILALRRGVSWKLLGGAAAVTAGGMLSRAMFAGTVVVLLGALLLGEWMHGERRWAARARRLAVIVLIPLATAAVTSGWFYLRNKHLTGSYTGGHNDWAEVHLHRTRSSFAGVLTANKFWHTNLQLLRQNGGTDAWLGPLLLEIVAAAAVVVCIVRLIRRGFHVEREQVAIALLLGAQLLVTLVIEAQYVAGGGGVITRYLLPALVPFGVLLASAVLALPRVLAGLALLGYLTIAWGFFIHWAWIQPIHDGSHWSGHTVNDVPWSVVTVALAGIVVGILAQAWALVRVQAAGRASAPTATGTHAVGPRHHAMAR